MLAAASLIIALLPTSQEPQVVEKTLEDGVRIRTEVAPNAEGNVVPHGDYTVTAPDGTALVEGAFKDGQRSGRWRYRYPDGELRLVGSFRAGQRSGTWEFRDPGGVVRAEGKFTRDAPRGSFTFQTEGGEPDTRYTGKYGTARGDWATGEPRFAGWTVDGESHGRWTFQWEDGSRMLEASFERGEPAGAWRFHHFGGVFDPEFVSGEYPLALDLQDFFEPPPLHGDSVATPHAAFDPAQLPAALRDIPPAPDAPEMTELLRSKIEVSIAAFARHPTEADRRLELERLVLWGPATMQVVLDELRQLAWREEDGLARAKLLVEDILTPLLGGRSFAWSWAATDEAWVLNRLSFLRTYSYYWLTHDEEAVWGLDLTLPRAAGETSQLLLRPPTRLALLTGEPEPPEPDAKVSGRRRRAGGSGTEQALEEGLAWLARHQSPNGSWDTEGFMHKGCGCDGPGDALHQLGITGLALLALLGDGNTLEEGAYRRNVITGVRWILSQQDPETGRLLFYAPIKRKGKVVRMYSSSYIYEHTIATLALCRALESAHSPVLRGAAQRAVDYIKRARNPYGAWRYDVPPVGDNDTSVTTWAAAALASADRAGLAVDRAAYVGTINWLDEVTDPANARIGYKSMGSVSARVTGINDHYPAEKGEAMTALGLLTRFRLGQDPALVPIMGKHADLMLKTLPEWDPEGYGCDMYYWYHGTHAMFRMGGRYWDAWNPAMKKALLESQRKDGDLKGSWDPIGPWGFAGGRIYSTAMMAMCLEVYRETR